MKRSPWIRGVMMSVVVALMICGCRTTFDLHPQQLPLKRGGKMETRKGEVVRVPRELTGKLVAPRGKRLMTTTEDSEVHLVPADHVDRAKRLGWRTARIVFEGTTSVQRDGESLLWTDEDGRLNQVEQSLVDYVKITDLDARRNKIIGIVVPSVLGGGAVIGLVVAFLVGLSNMRM